MQSDGRPGPANVEANFDGGTGLHGGTGFDRHTAFDRVINQRPGYAAALRSVEAELWQQKVLDPVTLELCRLRIAQLLGCEPESGYRTPEAVASGLDESVVSVLSQWPEHDRFDRHMRTCLGYAEQLLLDAQGVTDDQADEVVAAIGEGGFLVLTYACGLFETSERARQLIGAGLGWSSDDLAAER